MLAHAPQLGLVEAANGHGVGRQDNAAANQLPAHSFPILRTTRDHRLPTISIFCSERVAQEQRGFIERGFFKTFVETIQDKARWSADICEQLRD